MIEMMKSVVIFFCILCSIETVSARLREERGAPDSCDITVTLRIENTVSNPIPASFITTVRNGTVLVDILNKAAKENKQGPFNRYESTYFGGLGYLITAINGTKQDLATSTFWLIFDDQSGGLIPCGVSSYVPADNSITIFRFTQYSPSSGHGNAVSGFCKPFPSPLQEPPPPITVTIGLDWDVASVGRPVPAAYTTQVPRATVLVDIMNKAADENTQGPFNRYASTYFGGLGHFITALDGVEQDPQTNTFWLIFNNITGQRTPVGVDLYRPRKDSVTVFRLVTLQ